MDNFRHCCIYSNLLLIFMCVCDSLPLLLCLTDADVVISPSPSPEPVRLAAETATEAEQPEPMDESIDVAVENCSAKQTVKRKLVSKTYTNDEGFMGE